MENYDHVTRHIQSLPKGPKIGAFFDFDGTVIDGYSAFTFLREQVKKGVVSPLGLVEIISSMVNYKLGMVDFSGLMSVGARVMEGISEEEYWEFSRKVSDKFVRPVVYPEARALIKAHQEAGHTVAIVSSATPYQLEFIAEELDIEHVYCSHYEVEEGRFTGKSKGPVCWGEGKVLAVEELAKTQKLDLSKSCFYSDSDDDLAVLERVGYPRIVNPNESLETIASEQGWPVQEFARTGKPGVLEYVRSVGVYGSLLASYFTGLGVWKLNGSKDEGRRFMLSLFTEVAFALIGAKLEVKNPENLWKKQPVLVIFNHQSQADGLAMMKLLRDNFAAVGKKEIGRFKLFAKAYEFAGIIPIDRANSKSAIEAMKPLVHALAVEKRNVVIAPEGTRSKTKKPGPFKKGAFHVAMQAGVPVLPIVIHNAIDIQPKGQFAYRPGKLEIEVLPPVETSGWKRENLDTHIAEVRNMFLTTLGYEAEPVPEPKTPGPQQKTTVSREKTTTTRKSATAKNSATGTKAATSRSTAEPKKAPVRAQAKKPAAPRRRKKAISDASTS